MKKSKLINTYSKIIDEKYGKEFSKKVVDCATKIYNLLLEENKDECKAVKAHTVEKIYPMIALFKALTENGKEKSEAQNFLDKTYSELAEKEAKSLRSLMKIPGAYKLMPKMFRSVTIKSFGENAGFKFHFYKTDKIRCKFDMTKCIYYDTCSKYGCPDLTLCFCHTDDVKNGNMHKKLIWHRTKTLGGGGDCCDFEIYIKED